ncbi:DUF1203 domain-containing protein [Phycicoccus sonneratiae]|uniref:DUF1203 domain-containing protein n=1 Tax=Phycicoccus sonneratiae TaxID=2807628 RepID=A0ABS2CJA1_9MICO|nr:DUF1203 domain-containing protein [Phycicoccus sonneraticus]MBM6399923.1 DUF1203 domain-containing protein [Phycicoccus sonneraticus]
MLLPIGPDELEVVRRDRVDAWGRRAEESTDLEGGSQLRCCLARAEPGERILLVGHAPSGIERPWQEVGPVFVHAGRCPHAADGSVPAWFDEDARVLRAYDAEGAMRYDHNRVVAAGEGVEAALREVLAHAEVAEVHVRNLLAQCFIARAVRRP